MVEVTKSELVSEFDGVCKTIEVVEDQLNEGQQQIHLEIEPCDPDLLKNSKTGRFHVYLRMTKSCTENSVAEGSVIHRYLQEVNAALPESKDKDLLLDSIRTLKDKKMHYVSKVLGKSYGGHESRAVFIPQRAL
jgi:hypothetical protein|tara:strand:+ start:899 stop:1300 length:402 start_codon:yes stop_codon:yes gene_type:complete